MLLRILIKIFVYAKVEKNLLNNLGNTENKNIYLIDFSIPIPNNFMKSTMMCYFFSTFRIQFQMILNSYVQYDFHQVIWFTRYS